MRIYLAGCDSAFYTQCAVAGGARYLLCSFWHSILTQGKNTSRAWIQLCRDLNKEYGIEFMLDSGLFTMIYSNTGKKYTHSYMEEYARNYISFIEKSKWLDIGTCVEIDAHSLTGMKSVFKIRDMFVSAGIADKTCFVWHKPEGLDGWRNLVQKYKLVSLPPTSMKKDFGSKTNAMKIIARMVSHANDINPETKIHILGCSDERQISQPGLFSVDSTTWLNSTRFGENVIDVSGKDIHAKRSSEVFREYAKKRTPEVSRRLRELGFTFPTTSMTRNGIVAALAADRFVRMNARINRRHYPNHKIEPVWNTQL